MNIFDSRSPNEVAHTVITRSTKQGDQVKVLVKLSPLGDSSKKPEVTLIAGPETVDLSAWLPETPFWYEERVEGTLPNGEQHKTRVQRGFMNWEDYLMSPTGLLVSIRGACRAGLRAFVYELK
jgi:hypothetical protein